MSADDVAVVRVAFETWTRGDMAAWLELLDAGIEWVVRPDLPDAGVYRGPEEVMQLLARFEEVLEDLWVEPQAFLDAGDCVVVPLHWGGRGRVSGSEVSEREGETWIFTVQNGRITGVREFRHKPEALDYAGLPR